jgi:predicted Zn-dependent peptidase
MVNLLLLIWTATALSLPSSGQSPRPSEKLLTLDNGLRVFLVQRDSVPLVNIVAAVNAGSKDETETTSGLTHLLEHYVLFRGTDFRTGGEIAREIRNHGAVFNAHTGQDLATFEISLPTEHFEFGLENQKEILFNLKIEEAELSAEKEVILEEIKQIEDDPFRYGGSLIYQNLMAGHPYGRPVYGSSATIRGLSREDVERFYRRFFGPNNTALAVVGNLPIVEMEERVRAVFGPVPRREPPPAPPERPRPLEKTVEVVKELDIDEAYLIIGALGPDYNDPGQYAADVLTQVLGQGINPMLAGAMKGGRRNLVNSAQMTYIALKRAGAFVAYLTLDPKNMAAAKKEAVAFLKRARTENFSPSDIIGEEKDFAFDHLEGAKNGLRFIVQQAWESGLGLAASMAMHLLLNDKETKIDYLDRLAAIRSSDLREAAAASFGRSDFVFVSFVPRKK